jgi:multidrug efflux system outer membrane protein
MVKRLPLNRWAFLAFYVLVSGCAPSLQNLKIREPETTMPEDFGIVPTAETKPAEPLSQGDLDWKKFFSDEKLSAIIGSAIDKNRELAIIEQDIRVSQNEIMSRQGEYIPKVGIKGGAGVEKVGKETSQGQSDLATGVAESLPGYSVGFFASWEIDIWGKLRNATKAALYRYHATVDGRNYMVTRLVAEIADTYYELRALHKKAEILEQNIHLQEQALEMMRLQKRAARVTELAVKRFEAEVLKNQSRRYVVRQSIIEKNNQLNFLAGRFPQQIVEDDTDFIAVTPRSIQAGVPSVLLQNRPDVRAAEFELKAAKLNVDSTRARFYPALSIEAGAGYQAFNTKHLFVTPDSMFYNFVGNLTAPLLNRMSIKADYLSAGSKQLQAVYNFEKTILTAYTEVVNQLNNIENLKSSFKLKSEQVSALSDAVNISNTLFRAARCDYMEVLLTRRDALESQMELVEVKQRQLSASVNLYKALGGGTKPPKVLAD